MDNIKEIIKGVIGKISEKHQDIEYKIENEWDKIISIKEKKHLRLMGYKEGKIFINVDSPAWLYQMKIQKNEILRKFNNIIPEIKDIVFRTGNV